MDVSEKINGLSAIAGSDCMLGWRTSSEPFSDKTEAQHGEVLRLLAANALLFAKLFGREVGGKPSPETLAGKEKPRTQADLLHRGQADTHLAASGDADAKERIKARKPANTLMSAIFG